jgi:predicted HTH transcriptional regulator
LLIQAAESGTCEFERSTGEMWDIAATVCAFGDDQGGTCLIGVTKAGEVLRPTLGNTRLGALGNRIRQRTAGEISRRAAAEPTAIRRRR